MKKMMLAAMLAGGLFVVGCKDEGGAKPAGGEKTSMAGETAAGGSTGVAECDDYITKMEACLKKMPAEAKGPMETAFKASRETFKANAATPEGKTALKMSCKALADGVATNAMCK